MKCKNCGEILLETDTFCGKCGARVQIDKCPRCGEPLRPGMKFCSSCGYEAVSTDDTESEGNIINNSEDEDIPVTGQMATVDIPFDVIERNILLEADRQTRAELAGLSSPVKKDISEISQDSDKYSTAYDEYPKSEKLREIYEKEDIPYEKDLDKPSDIREAHSRNDKNIKDNRGHSKVKPSRNKEKIYYEMDEEYYGDEEENPVDEYYEDDRYYGDEEYYRDEDYYEEEGYYEDDGYYGDEEYYDEDSPGLASRIFTASIIVLGLIIVLGIAALFFKDRLNIGSGDTETSQEAEENSENPEEEKEEEVSENIAGTVTIAKDANIRDYPSTENSTVILTARAGTVYEYYGYAENSNKWVHIKVDENTDGYVYIDLININN